MDLGNIIPSKPSQPIPESWWEKCGAKINAWRRNVMSDTLFMLWLAFFIGIAAGFAAHIFNRLISIVTNIFTMHIKPDELNWWLIPVPVIGILITGIYTRYIIHTNLTHGVARLSRDLGRGIYRIKGNIIYSPIIGGTITLGFGGSAGSEGPIAYSGAAIGSNLGRILGVNQTMMQILIGCGAGAAIAGIFQSPMGGLLFILEYLQMEMATIPILAITLACFTAYGTVFVCNGCVPIHTFLPDQPIMPHYYWAIIALGIFCGLYSLYYSEAINRSDAFFVKIKNPWIRNITGGLIIGISIFLFPSLYGVGYPVISDTIHNHFSALSSGDILESFHFGKWGLIIIAACVLLIKCWACGSCNACGGVSSDFAPTLFAGAIAGFLFASLCNEVFETHLPVGVFTLLGAAGVMAGTVEAPLMTLFIVINMGTSIDFAFGIGLSVLFAYGTVRVCSILRGYDSKMMKHLKWFHNHQDDKNKTTN